MSRIIAGLAVAVAAIFTAWGIAAMLLDLTQQNGGGPWLLCLLYGLLLVVFWAGMSLLRWRSTLGIVVLILSASFALPLGLFALLIRMADD